MGSICRLYHQQQCTNLNESLLNYKILCRQNNYNQYLRKQNPNKSSIKIQFEKKTEQGLRRSQRVSQINRESKQVTIVGILHEDGINLLFPSNFEDNLSNAILKLTQNKSTVIFIQQPICSKKINIQNIFQSVIKSILTTEAQIELRGINRSSKKMIYVQNRHQLQKITILVFWPRISSRKILPLLQQAQNK